MFSLHHDNTVAYIKEVEEERKKKEHHLNKQVKLAIDESFIDELLKHDFVSSKKGKRLGNILLEKKFRGAKHLRE